MKIKFDNITDHKTPEPLSFVVDIKDIKYEHYRIPVGFMDTARMVYHQQGVESYVGNTNKYMFRYSPKDGFIDKNYPDIFPRKDYVMAQGGKTVITITTSDKTGLYIGITVCSIDDNFCYETGRREALADAITNILSERQITRSKKFILSITDEILFTGWCYKTATDLDNLTIVIDMTNSYGEYDFSQDQDDRTQDTVKE